MRRGRLVLGPSGAGGARRPWGPRSRVLATALAAALAAATSAQGAADPVASITLKEGRLSSALQELAVARRVGILFSPDTVGSRLNPSVAGRMSVEEALSRLLAGSGLGFRRTGEGAFVIYPLAVVEPAPVVSEVLVVGRKMQNADIRRTESDIQPYQVLSSRDIAGFRADEVGQLVRDRFTFDAHGATADPLGNRSSFNIHGLGADETLVLVDGMRMPGIPRSYNAARLGQSDLNAIPLMAIERVEALTATSGGIYGPGATGGVINVVLKRDYRGAEVSTGLGVTGRGDGVRKRFDARLGFTPDDGRTDIMLTLSRATSQGLRAGERDYDVKARRLRLASGEDLYPQIPFSEGTAVLGAGDELTLKPAYGGQGLGASWIILPSGYADLRSQAGQATLAKTLNWDEALVMANPHDRTTLTPPFKTTSMIASLRHDFGRDIEGFLDAIYLENDSSQFRPGETTAYLSASDPNNIFEQDVYIRVGMPGFGRTTQDDLRSYRVSAGVIAPLARGWRGELSYSLGGARNVETITNITGDNNLYGALNNRAYLPADFSTTIPDVFGDWSQFVTDLQAYKQVSVSGSVWRQRFQDASLRLGGPLMRTGAGPVSLSLAAEWRYEDARPPESFATDQDNSYLLPYTQAVVSLQGEVRAPLVPRSSGPRILRGLELQLAGRYDDNKVALREYGRIYAKEGLNHASRETLASVVGLRAFPLDQLMVRASLATGALPPEPLLMQEVTGEGVLYISDPKRRYTTTQTPTRWWSSGSPNVKPERARALSFGLVINPEGGARPRVSLDYTRIDKRDELNAENQGNIWYFLLNESLFPGRIKRAPLTADDIAAGYTGGVITEVDLSPINIGRATIETIDLKADYSLAIASAAVLRLYGSTTWTRRFDWLTRPNDIARSYVGSLDGPIGWRANVGVDLDHGPWSLGLNGQFYGLYDDVSSGEIGIGMMRERVSSQVYLDLKAAYRLQSAAYGMIRGLEFKFGVANLLDAAGPTTWNGASPFGDPRGRRFDATITARF